jgi:hypothetical protein
MMYDGSSKAVETITAGDLLMGHSDNNVSMEAVEVVTGSLNKGHSTLYEIISDDEGRTPWKCNADHILVLQWNVRPSIVRLHRHRASWTFSMLTERRGKVVMLERSFDTKAEADTARELAMRKWMPLVREYAVQDFLKLSKRVQRSAQMFQPDLVQFAPPTLPLQTRMESAWQRKVTDEHVLDTGQWATGDYPRHTARCVARLC